MLDEPIHVWMGDKHYNNTVDIGHIVLNMHVGTDQLLTDNRCEILNLRNKCISLAYNQSGLYILQSTPVTVNARAYVMCTDNTPVREPPSLQMYTSQVEKSKANVLT